VSAPTPRLFAEFTRLADLRSAIDALRHEGYDDFEAYSPYDVPELDAPLRLGRSRLGWLVLLGGLIGLVAGYVIQWWANVHSYPLSVGGRPQHAIPAFIPAAFEATVLGASLAAFIGLLAVLRLPKLWAPEDEIDGFERATVDRYWLSVSLTHASHPSRAEQALRLANAQRIVAVPPA